MPLEAVTMRKYLPCDRVAYDPYDHNNSHTRHDDSVTGSDSVGDSSGTMGTALTLVSVVAVAATALLVLSLWRQQQKSR